MTSFTGDADVYAVVNGSLPGTEPGTWQYASTLATGVDRIVISALDPAWQAGCGALAAQGLACPIYILVFGFSASVWSLVASATAYVGLTDGVPQNGFVIGRAYDYYVFNLRSPVDVVTFTATPLSGASTTW